MLWGAGGGQIEKYFLNLIQIEKYFLNLSQIEKYFLNFSEKYFLNFSGEQEKVRLKSIS